MKIVKVNIKKFKKLEDLATQLDGHDVIVIGDNEVGKTSFLQFIKIALGQNTNIPPEAQGSEGYVIIDKEGKKYKFHVKFNKDGKPVLTVTTPDGLRDDRKGTITGIVGPMNFSIDKFVEMSKTVAGRKEQVVEFKKFLPEDVIADLTKYEVNIKKHYDDRTELNKDIKKLRAKIDLSPVVKHIHELQKFQAVDTSKLMSDLTVSQEHNNKVQKVKDGIEERKTKNTDLEKEIEELEKQIKAKGELIDKNNADITSGDIWLKNNPIISVEELNKIIKNATETNNKAAQAKELKEDLELLTKYENEAGEMTALIDSSTEAIANTIRDMDGPIEGLTFDDSMLYYKGIPVNPDSLSTSQIIELGIRLKRAENPNFDVLFIDNGESIGKNRLEIIREFAKMENCQIIMTEVKRGQEEIKIEIMEAE